MPPAPPPNAPSYPANDPYGYDYGPTAGSAGAGSSGGSFLSSTDLLNYDLLTFEYVHSRPKEDALTSSNGLQLGLMVQIFKPLFIHGQFGWAAGSESGTREYDFTTTALGVGTYLPIASWFHIMGEAGVRYGKRDSKIERFDVAETSFYLRPALRLAPLPFLELQAGYTFSSTDEYDTALLDLTTYFRVFSHLDLSLGVDLGDEANHFTGGLRFRW
jgi:hypothetical protein